MTKTNIKSIIVRLLILALIVLSILFLLFIFVKPMSRQDIYQSRDRQLSNNNSAKHYVIDNKASTNKKLDDNLRLESGCKANGAVADGRYSQQMLPDVQLGRTDDEVRYRSNVSDATEDIENNMLDVINSVTNFGGEKNIYIILGVIVVLMALLIVMLRYRDKRHNKVDDQLNYAIDQAMQDAYDLLNKAESIVEKANQMPQNKEIERQAMEAILLTEQAIEEAEQLYFQHSNRTEYNNGQSKSEYDGKLAYSYD